MPSDPDSQSSSSKSQAQASGGAPSSGKEQGLLSKVYFALEDKYYDACDFLHNAGIPIYKFWVDPIESRGVPSFPVTMGVFFLILLALFLLFQPAPLVDVSVKVLAGGKALGGANVSLQYGDQLFWRFSSTGGNAVFEGLKPGARALLNASKQGYVPVKPDFSFLVEESRSIQFELRAPAIENASVEKELLLRVYSKDGSTRKRLAGVEINYFSPDGSLLGSVETDSSGQAGLLYDGVNALVYLELKKEGFADVSGFGVFFNQKVAEIDMSAEEVVKKSRVLVTVQNQSGSPVVSMVSVFGEDGSGPLKSELADSQGQVDFEVEMGSRIYVNAVANSQADKDKYAPFYGSDRVFSANKEEYAYTATLLPRAGTGIAVVKVVDASSNAPIANAVVTIYGQFNKLYLDSASTDSSGEVEFALPNSTVAYATAYASGYLPEGVVNVKTGATKTISLKKSNSTNSGFAKITVLERNQSLVSGARVVLNRNIDGFPLGLPVQTTNASGFVVFSSVPAGLDVYAQATLGARTGQSPAISTSPNSTKLANVTLETGFGNVTVQVYNAYTGQKIANANVRATTRTGTALASCTAAQGACEMLVESYTSFTIVASAQGFANASQDHPAMPVDTILLTSAYLVPDGMQNEFFATLNEVQDEGGNAVDFIQRGKQYKALFTAHFPANVNNATGSFYARIGGNGTAAQSDFVITDAAASDSNQKSVGTNLDTSCSQGSTNCLSASEGCKWARLEFKNVSGKAYSPTITFKVRAISVSSEQAAKFQYRALANVSSANGSITILRSPQDLAYPIETSPIQDCQAKYNQTEIPLEPGATTCSNNACVTLAFVNASGTYGDGFETQVGSKFNISITTRLLPQSTPAASYSIALNYSPHAKLLQTAPGWMQSGQGSLSTTLTVAESASTFEFNASAPSIIFRGAEASANFTMGNSQSSFAQARYTIAGADWLSVSAKAENAAQSQGNLMQSENNNLVISVNDSLGKPLVDASVYIRNNGSDTSLAFATQQFLLAQGDNTTGKGKDGRYNFSGIVPASTGWVQIEAIKTNNANVRGYAYIESISRPFFEVNFQQIFTCNSSSWFNATNRLGTTLSVLINASQWCVEKVGGISPNTVLGFDYYSFQLAPLETKNISITQNKTASKACTLAATATNAGEEIKREIQYASAPSANCKGAGDSLGKVPSCILVPLISERVGPFDSILVAEYNFVPKEVYNAAVYCNKTDSTPIQAPINSTNQANRTCHYGAAAATHFANASISSSAKALIGPRIGNCSAQITAKAPSQGIDFILNSTGVYALKQEFEAKITPLLPVNAINVSVKNEFGEPKTISFETKDPDNACLKLTYSNGTIAGFEANLPAKSTAYFVLLYGPPTNACTKPDYAPSGNSLSLTDIPQKSQMSISAINAQVSIPSAKVNIQISQDAETKDFAFARIALNSTDGAFLPTPQDAYGAFIVFANNIQAPRINASINTSSPVDTSAIYNSKNPFDANFSHAISRTFKPASGDYFGSGDLLYSIKPVGILDELFDFGNYLSSPLVASDADSVHGQINDAYNYLLLENDSITSALLGIPEKSQIIVPLSSPEGMQLYRYDISLPGAATDFTIPDGKRCQITLVQRAIEQNSDNFECKECGVKSAPCCTSAPACEAGSLCIGGTCESCGGPGQRCCAGKACEDQNNYVCIKDDNDEYEKCHQCGDRTEYCCSTTKGATSTCHTTYLNCYNGVCNCGGEGQECCAASSGLDPCRPDFECENNKCNSNGVMCNIPKADWDPPGSNKCWDRYLASINAYCDGKMNPSPGDCYASGGTPCQRNLCYKCGPDPYDGGGEPTFCNLDIYRAAKAADPNANVYVQTDTSPCCSTCNC